MNTRVNEMSLQETGNKARLQRFRAKLAAQKCARLEVVIGADVIETARDMANRKGWVGQGTPLTRITEKQRVKIPWEKIRNDFRTGMPASAISFKYNNCVTQQGISKRAKKEGWTQDLMAEVAARTIVKLVVGVVGVVGVVDPNADAEAAIDQAAEVNVTVILTHRRDIHAGRQLTNLLFGQLQVAAQTRDEIGETIETETVDDITTKRRDAMRRAISLPQHAATLRDLTVAMKNLIGLEREAYHLGDAPVDGGIEAWLKRIENHVS